MYAGIFFIIVGTLLCGYCLYKLRTSCLYYFWPSAMAKLYPKEFRYIPRAKSLIGGGSVLPSVDIVIMTYRYKVSGQEYSGEFQFIPEENFEESRNFGNIPNEIIVYYDPERPWESVPENERSFSRILLGLLMVALSVLFILVGTVLSFPGAVTRTLSPEPDWREVKRAVIAARKAHPPTITLSAVSDDYKYTQDVKTLAEKGYTLFKEGKFVSSFNNGHYTDTDPNIMGFDFWSNGKMVMVDRDHNGHFETIFMIKDDALVYVGSIGSKGVYVDVGEGFESYLGHYRAF